MFTVKERKRIQIVDYRGSKALTTTNIEDKLKEKEAALRHRQLLRPGQGAAGGGHHQGDAGGEGPALRHGQARRQGGGRRRQQVSFVIDDGPKAKVKADRVHGQRGRSPTASCAAR